MDRVTLYRWVSVSFLRLSLKNLEGECVWVSVGVWVGVVGRVDLNGFGCIDMVAILSVCYWNMNPGHTATHTPR